MAADLPMLGLVENESDMKAFLEDNNLGKSLPWDSSSEMLVETISNISKDVKDGRYKPASMRHLYHRTAAKDQWLELMSEINSRRQA